jgi:hypothetical protein
METQTTAFDPVLANFDMPLREVFYPLGFSVEITTNSREVLAGAQESWGHFRKVFAEPAVTLRIGVLDSGPELCPPPPVCRSQEHLLTRIADVSNYSVSDMARGFSHAWLTPAAAANRAYLRYHFIEGMAWDLIESLYITSIHAACVSKQGRGVLLCGDSGAGKSSLSFACARRGWAFLSDDSTCLIRGRKDRVAIGNPYQIRFRESAVELFPELADQKLTLRATGEFAFEIPTACLRNIETASECSVDFIVFLNRGTLDPPGLRPVSRSRALKTFEDAIQYREQAVRDAHKATLRNLFTAPVFELRYRDLESAINLLEDLVRDGAPPPVPKVHLDVGEGADA